MTFLDEPSHHSKNPTRRSCALSIAVDLLLHVKKIGLPLSAEKKMVNYKYFGLLRPAFSGYRKFSNDLKGPERRELVTEASTEGGVARASRRLRFE